MIRTVLYQMENLNKDIFSRFLIPRHVSETIVDHIRTISSPQSWATQVEVVAAASVFQVPVYYCSKNKDSYKWNVVKPFFSYQCTLKLPALPQPDDSITRLRPTLFELFYDNRHYDAIVSATTGKVCTSPPTLSHSHSDQIDLTF